MNMNMNELIQEHLKRWEPIKIEFLDLKDRLYKLDSSIEIIAEEYIIISSPKFGGEKYDLPVNSEVNIAFYRPDGILYAQTKILGKQSGVDSRYKISKPYNLELIERRRARRARMNLKLEVEYYLNKNSLQKKILNEVTYDINTYSLSYISDMPFGKYYGIKCRIYLNTDFKNPVEVKCKYISSREKKIKGQPMYQVAFEFEQIPEEDIMRIQQKCYRRSLI